MMTCVQHAARTRRPYGTNNSQIHRGLTVTACSPTRGKEAPERGSRRGSRRVSDVFQVTVYTIACCDALAVQAIHERPAGRFCALPVRARRPVLVLPSTRGDLLTGPSPRWWRTSVSSGRPVRSDDRCRLAADGPTPTADPLFRLRGLTLPPWRISNQVLATIW
jgi:hypothetical protein